MLTEGISGTCPCCGYTKMLQRYGSWGYYQLDGCPNCGFGYGTDGEESPLIGTDGWIWYGLICLAIEDQHKYIHEFEDDPDIKREGSGWIKENGGSTKEEKAFEKAKHVLGQLDDLELRKKVFEWAEACELNPNDMHISTVFTYTDKDIANYKATNPVIFKTVKIEAI